MIRVLVVDDTEENLYYLSALLTGHGFAVEAARHGVAALAQARAAPPGLVISDLLMPTMDGYALLRRWKSDPRLKSIPFIVYTATYTQPEDEQLALSLGADAFIVKPAEPDDFLTAVRRVLAGGGVPRQPTEDDAALLQRYTESLVRKLEDKTDQLEETNRALQQESADRHRMAETQRAILDALPAQVALVDAGGVVLAVNEAWRSAVADGLPDRGIGIGDDYLKICEGLNGAGGPGVAGMAAGIRTVLRGEADAFALVYPCHLPNDHRWFRLVATPLHKGTLSGAVVMHVDVTERIERNARLQQQSALLDNAKDAITVRDLDHRIHYWNRAAERFYGWTSEEVLGRPVDELLHGHDHAGFHRAAEAVLDKGEWSGRMTQTTRDNRVITVASSWTLVRGDAEKPASIFAIDTDIAERLDLERRLAQSQRLQAIGQLTGGVAHDFNNLLGVISGNMELLDEALPDRPDLREMLRAAIRATDRGAALTLSLLSFSLQRPLEPRAFDPNGLIREMTGLVRRTVHDTIQIELIAFSTWRCDADPGQLQNALLNLVMNARDAMPDGGLLTVETGDVDLAEPDAARAEVAPGEYVMVAVSDSGLGMTPEIVARAFEPFFSTKEIGRGTGLGLSMVYGFARQSLGYVKITSEPGHGTTVRLYLPRSADEADRPESPVAPALSQGRGETILVVDDDVDMRRLTCGLLLSLGYVVLEAGDVQAALGLVRSVRNISILLIDVMLPGELNSRLLVDEARPRNPNLEVIFMSGYTENSLFRPGRPAPAGEMLRKPFRKHDLAVKLRAVLDRETPS